MEFCIEGTSANGMSVYLARSALQTSFPLAKLYYIIFQTVNASSFAQKTKSKCADSVFEK